MRSVTLSNGLTFDNVPDNVSDGSLVRFAVDKGIAKPEEFNVQDDTYDPTEEMGTGARLLAGIGGGISNVYEQAKNVLGADNEELIESREQTDEPLMSTGAGQVGDFVGEAVATAPLFAAGPAPAAARVGMTSGRALIKSAGGAKEARRLLKARRAAQLAGSATGYAAGGAASGALLGGPENRGAGAAAGAVGSVLIPGVGNVLKGAGRKFRSTVKLKPEARRWMQETGDFVGVADAADNDVWQAFFRNYLGNLPGAQGIIRAQQVASREQDYYKFLTKMALPRNMERKLREKVNAKGDIHGMYDVMNKAWKDAYEVYHPYKVKTAPGVEPSKKLQKLILKMSGDFDEKGLPLGRPTTMKEILTLKTAMRDMYQDVYKKSRPLAREINSWIEQDGVIDKIVINGMRLKGKKGAELAKVYQNDLREPYWLYSVMQDASKISGKEGGRFTPKQALAKAFKRGGRDRYAGGRAMQQKLDDAARVFNQTPSMPNLFQMVSAMSLPVAVLTFAGFNPAVGMAGAAVVGRMLASKTFQQKLMGTAGKKAQTEARRRVLEALGVTGRDALAIANQRYVTE